MAKKRFLAVLLVIVCVLNMSMSVFAAEQTTNAVTDDVNFDVTEPATPEVTPRSIYGYAAKYTSPSTGSFTVDAPGSGNVTGATITTTDFSSEWIYVRILNPDGTCVVSNTKLVGNTEVVKSFSKGTAGTYTVYYTVYGSGCGWLHVWIY
jgi:hypothetical protein